MKSWVLRAKLNEKYELIYDEEENHSVILNKEIVWGIYEYAKNKLVITTYPNVVLIVHDWKQCRIVVSSGNIGNK